MIRINIFPNVGQENPNVGLTAVISCQEITTVGQEIASVRQEIVISCPEVVNVGQEIASVRQEIGFSCQEIASVGQEIASVGQEKMPVGHTVETLTIIDEDPDFYSSHWNEFPRIQPIRRLSFRKAAESPFPAFSTINLPSRVDNLWGDSNNLTQVPF